MKKSLSTLFVLITALVLAIPFAPAAAQTTSKTLPFTEDEVNQTFWVTNPLNRRVSDVYVNLQPNQVMITATYTVRAARTGATTSYDFSVTLEPAVVNGRVQWNVTAASADGQPASADLLTQINLHLATTWRRYVSNTRPNGRLIDVTITEDDITFTYL